MAAIRKMTPFQSAINELVINQASFKQRIPQSEYIPALNDLLSCLKTGLGSNLHSVYVYGSVADGRAVASVSNLDLVLVTNHHF